MATFTKFKLSGSTDGKPILGAATAIGSGDTIHTAHATALDEIWLWVNNVDSVAVNMTIGWGGTTDPDHLIAKTVPIPANSGPILVVAGQILTNSLVVKVAGSTTNKLVYQGYVNRIG